MAAPPVTSLRELEAVALQLTSKRIDDLDALRRWLAVLVAPGASLGGARPKANFTAQDGSLWIAKFPARDDDRDVGAWEFVVHQLAQQAGIEVPPARLAALGSAHRTFCVQRFDRHAGQRRFYASALTLLRREHSEGASYLELAQFLHTAGEPAQVAGDLAQLFRRIAFNIAVGNRDDHLRNHGFVLAQGGWRLAPAFDMNPNIDKAEHVLAIDDHDPRPSMANLLTTCAFYRLDRPRAEAIVGEVLNAVREWPSFARRLRVSEADIVVMSGAFAMQGKA